MNDEMFLDLIDDLLTKKGRTKVAKLKEKELVHWFKVAVASDPKTPISAHEAEKGLMEVDGVTDVNFLRSTMRTAAGE